MRIETIALRRIKPNPRNARLHSGKQITLIEKSIQTVGFANPLLVDENLMLIAGHGRLTAAKNLGFREIPAIILPGLTEAKKRLLALADNKIPEHASWDRERLAVELPELADLLVAEDVEIDVSGFTAPEIDALRVDFQENSDSGEDLDLSWSKGPAVSDRGSLWILGKHRLLCGDARNGGDLDRLMGSGRAAMAFLDVPYNLAVRRIGGRGRIKHREFAMASGEMTPAEYVQFLLESFGNASRVSRDGAVHFICCDWRHIEEILQAGKAVYQELLNTCVWVKSNGGQGSFYRSRHELIPVFRVGGTQHLNNVQLGRHGRNRTNVWEFAGVNSFRAGRMDELSIHPTAKPVALVAEAIKDCTGVTDTVLDTFCGSGTTIMAAERVGRRGYGMEIDPVYVDAIVRRWQAQTQQEAFDSESGLTFDEIANRHPKVAKGLPSDPVTARSTRRRCSNTLKSPSPSPVAPPELRSRRSNRHCRSSRR